MNPEAGQIIIRIVGGPDSGAAWALDSRLVTVGRSSVCDIGVTDLTVSRTHLRLERTGGSWQVEHLGGRNGTHVNGREVREDEPPVAICSGDRISFGSSVMVVEFRDEGPADAITGPLAASGDPCPAPDQSIQLGAPPSMRPPEVGAGRPVAPSPWKRLAVPLALVVLALIFIATVLIRSCV